jgi:hypothetical protein
MQEQPVIVRERGSGTNSALVATVAIIAVVVLVGLFMWQPWNAQARHDSTTIVQPVAPGQNGAGAGNNAGSSNGGAGSNAGSSNTGNSGSSQSH